MFRNYLKIALRTLRKHKGYTLINIVGLAIGIASCVLILLYVQDELSYDAYHERADRIYRVALERRYPNRVTHYALTPAPLAPTLEREYPEVVTAARIWQPFGPLQVQVQDDEADGSTRRFEESRFLFADSTLFGVFTLALVEGNPNTALVDPNTVVITTETARRYFGDTNALGRTLTSDFGPLTVTGVMEPVPSNSHAHFDLLGSMATLDFIDQANWVSFSNHAYIVLQPGASPEALEAKLPDMVRRHVGPQILDQLGTSFDDYQAAGNGYVYYLQALTDIHLTSHLESELEPNGNLTYVYLFAIIAGFILLLACINFMNLATARSAGRAKEVGVRKVLGSRRNQLIRQFLSESIVLSFLALILAVGVIELLLPYFNAFVEKDLALPYFTSWLALPVLIGFTLFVGLLAGSYPAFLLSGFRPATVLKGKFQTSKQSVRSRNGLVVFQFAITIMLLAGTSVVYRQIDFLQTTNLGFDKEHVVVIENAWPLTENRTAFKQQLQADPKVLGVSVTSAVPGRYFPGEMFQTPGARDVLTTRLITADPDFLETLRITLVDGRYFEPEYGTDSLAVVLNRAAVDELNLVDPVGQTLLVPGNTPEETETVTVIGILDDFHFQSLHQRISPLALRLVGADENAPYLAVRIRPGELEETLALLEATWTSFLPEQPFRYSFLDRSFDALYQAEQKTGRLTAVFSGLAILIACLGLFGLAAFTAEQRTKEIGVRKVMGASASGIVLLLSKEFARLVVLAFVVAAPVAYLGVDRWLSNFAYGTDVGPGVFLLAGGLALTVALLTVSYQAVKAALTNPVDALRYE